MPDDDDPDLWDDNVLPPSPEGKKLRERREKLRAEMDARDKRIATVIANAARFGWQAFVIDVGPRIAFARWGHTVEKQGIEAAEAFVKTLGAE